MYNFKAYCTRVVDGDTIDFNVDLGFHLSNKIRVRLLGIDTPEIRGSEKEFGKVVSSFVEDLLLPKNEAPPIINLKTEKTGSFGRWLGVVTLEDGETIQSKIRKRFPDIE